MGKSNNSKENEEDGSTYPLLRSGMDLSGISDVLMSSEVSATLKKVAEAAGSTSQLMAPLRATANQAMEAYLKAIPVISPELIMPSADTMRAIQKLAASLYATRIDISRYTKIDRPKSTYSAEFTSTEVYFESAERHVTSFADLNSAIADLIKHTGGLRLVWRGQADAAWGIHSGLYRRLMEINGVKNPLEKPRGEQPYPTEDQMVAAE